SVSSAPPRQHCSSLLASSVHLVRRHSSFLMLRPPPSSTLFPYTTLFRSAPPERPGRSCPGAAPPLRRAPAPGSVPGPVPEGLPRSEEHTSELQSRFDLVCRLLLEKKKKEGKHIGRPWYHACACVVYDVRQ